MKKYTKSIIVFLVTYFLLLFFDFSGGWSFFIALVVSFITYHYKGDQDHKKEIDDIKIESGLFGEKPRKGTEAYKVQKAVAQKKKIAEDRGLKELVGGLYFGEIEHYPSWIKNDNREYVPAIVTKSVEEDIKDNEDIKKIVKITLNSKEYKFTFSESSFSTPDGEMHNHGKLTLFSGTKKVFVINASLDDNDYDFDWRPFGIDAFIEGDWIEDFQSLKEAKQKAEKDRSIKRAEDPEKIEKLKQDFGIED